MDTLTQTSRTTIEGHAYALFGFDLGFQIDLDAAERLAGDSTRQHISRTRRTSPAWFDYSPAPLRLAIEGAQIEIDGQPTAASAEVLIYDFGAALITYRLPLPTTLDELPRLSVALEDHAALQADARTRMASVLDTIGAAVERPALSDAVEDYVVFSLTSWGNSTPAEVLDEHRATLAQAIEAERAPLAAEQIARSTETTLSYTETDLAILDWNGAILFDAEPDDVLILLQHANLELLQLRILDQELDEILDHADESLAALTSARVWPTFASRRMMQRLATAQTDSAVRFEGVNNAIKLMGNQYLARFYRQAAARLDLQAWQGSVQRKLEATESLYDKMSDSMATHRLELLEWVIIVLIAVSIVLPFTPWYH